MPYSRIIGTGSYTPEKILDNHDLEKMVETSDEWITERTGIKFRHIADTVDNSEMASRAAQSALQAAQLNPEKIDLIIAATVTPDYIIPSLACLVRNKIGATNAAAFDLNAGCTGFIYGITMADGMIRSGIYHSVLVIGTEKLTSLTNWTDRNTCVLFGDGAGAVVLQQDSKPGIVDASLAADSKDAMELFIPAGGSSCPLTPELLANHQHKIYMNGSAIFKLGVKAMVSISKKILKKNNLSANELDWLIPHQANRRIIDSVADLLRIDQQKVIINLENYGNTSAATIGIALDEAVRDGRIQPGHHVLLTAFGAGLTWGSVLIRM
ncbi:MAG: ketoacyl-ACP synthase III [Candidatus Delongbacteria bacterium]|nr:ketoacyl-ACP synthase III [Candidatus Delongbacteria bacterium]